MKYPHLQKMDFTHKIPLAPINNSSQKSFFGEKLAFVAKKVVIVYQTKNQYGFGDFIRGCLCLIPICEYMGLDFDIDLSNHPLSKFVEGHIKNPSINYSNVYHIKELNEFDTKLCYDTFKTIIQNVDSEVFYASSNAYPVFKNKPSHFEFIKSRIMPNTQMRNEIEQELINLELVNSEYSVIHIRMGDNFLFNVNNGLQKNKVSELFNKLRFLLNNKNCKYLILSDCVKLKMLFKPYVNCVFQIKQIAHLGEQPEMIEAVRNTMLDFYLMSRATNIYSYSSYNNFSGFSKWCANIYNIPYAYIT
jgi:hypothetical protein